MSTSKFTLTIAILAFAFSSPAWSDEYNNCASSPSTITDDPIKVRSGQVYCYDFVNADGTGIDEVEIRIETNVALFDFNSDTGGVPAAGTATIDILRCTGDFLPASSPGNSCHSILDAPLDGTAGGPTTQNASVEVSRGVYVIQRTAAPTGGESPRVEIRGVR